MVDDNLGLIEGAGITPMVLASAQYSSGVQLAEDRSVRVCSPVGAGVVGRIWTLELGWSGFEIHVLSGCGYFLFQFDSVSVYPCLQRG